MKFFDANIRFGSETVNHEVVNHERFIVLEKVEIAPDAHSLISYMDHAGIDKALVWHTTMYELDPTYGNDLLIGEIKGYGDRLIPSWTILPCITDKQYRPDVFFDSMKKNGVKALRAYPDKDRFFLNGVTMKEQLDLLCELKIPLYLEPQAGFEYVYETLKEFPALTVILCNIGIWPSARYVYPLLKTYKNFYFETGDFGMLRGYEEICSSYGSERLLFGSNFPTNNMGCSMYHLVRADISDDAKENISHRNLERLLNEVKL